MDKEYLNEINVFMTQCHKLFAGNCGQYNDASVDYFVKCIIEIYAIPFYKENELNKLKIKLPNYKSQNMHLYLNFYLD